MHFGNRPAGEIALQRLIEIEPDNIEALQLLAQERLRQLREADSDAEQNASCGARSNVSPMANMSLSLG